MPFEERNTGKLRTRRADFFDSKASGEERKESERKKRRVYIARW